jgi:L-fuculose-phosphate aldolase
MTDARGEVLGVAKQLLRRGLVEGTSGNVSARVDDANVCITPSSVRYETMDLDDLVIVDLAGLVVEGHRKPSSERALHLAAYRAFPEIRSVIHTHPVYATMFACAREPIPAVVDEIAIYIGGDVPVCEYAMSGTEELAQHAVAKLSDAGAALLANHGMVTVGTDPWKALHATALVERTAQIVAGARLLGDVHRVPHEVSATFAKLYRHLRQNPQP